jgi:hypothetical protein
VLDAPRQEPAQFLHAADERVALALELLEVEQTGTRRGGDGSTRDGRRRRDVRKGFGNDARQIPLESRHLCSQRVPGRALSILHVEIDDWLLRPIDSHTRLLQIAR